MSDNVVKLLHWELSVPNLKEYHTLKREIFSAQDYFFELDKPTPVIIDVGAHIGLTTLYYKRLFPQSKIIALEPHPDSFKYLVKNLEMNHIESVLPLNQALWLQKQKLTLFTDPSPESWWSNTSSIDDPRKRDTHTKTISVDTVTLKELHEGLETNIDLIKLDVEGAEWDILFKSLHHFDYIDRFCVEYHPQKGRSLFEFTEKFPNTHKVTCFKNSRRINPRSRLGGHAIVWATRI